MATSRNAYIPYLASQEEYFDLFDGITGEVPDAASKKKLPGGLLKSYLLETVGPSTQSEQFEKLLRRSGLFVEAVGGDETVYRVVDDKRQGIALAERFGERYLAFYTLLPSRQSDTLVGKAVQSNPMLDHLWVSSQTFGALWDYVRSVNSGKRYGRLTFEHESLFDVSEELEEEGVEPERRTSRFTMVDRLDVIQTRMPSLQEMYSPLHSITHLRIPAASRGGHDLYFDGKITNRSDSFLDHRGALKYVVSVYSQLTADVEDRLWFSDSSDGVGDLQLHGAVAELVFGQPLSEATFRRWVMTLFNKRNNRFRIGGFPTWISERKVQANAIDLHLWQPLLLELTPRRVIAVLPKGTCGNTINRLVSNIQRFVDPNVTAYVGDANYSDLVPRPSVGHVA